jgi:glutamate/tyrosine decarboxylase-like PLP-dependent enzyme
MFRKVTGEVPPTPPSNVWGFLLALFGSKESTDNALRVLWVLAAVVAMVCISVVLVLVNSSAAASGGKFGIAGGGTAAVTVGAAAVRSRWKRRRKTKANPKPTGQA